MSLSGNPIFPRYIAIKYNLKNDRLKIEYHFRTHDQEDNMFFDNPISSPTSNVKFKARM